MNFTQTTALVTGANRGFGLALAEELLARGATVYAAARNPETITLEGVKKLRLDITNPTDVAQAADIASDVMETNYFGTLATTQAFAPVLKANGGGAVLNILSAAAWTTVEGNGAYAAAKSAEWSLTNGLRAELSTQGTQVSAVYPVLIATDTLLEFAKKMGVTIPAEKLNTPSAVARHTLDGLARGEAEILDSQSFALKQTLINTPEVYRV